MTIVVSDTFECLFKQYKCLLAYDPRVGTNPHSQEYAGMVFNQTIVALELLAYYRQVFSFPGDKFDDHPEETQRIVMLQKHHLLGVVSSFEHLFMKMINSFPESLWYSYITRKEKHIQQVEHLIDADALKEVEVFRRIRKFIKDLPPINTMRRIIDRCYKHGMLSDENVEIIRSIFALRNAIVHNNGIADCDIDLQLPVMSLQWRKGEMMNGPKNCVCTLSLHFFDITLGVFGSMYDVLSQSINSKG